MTITKIILWLSCVCICFCLRHKQQKESFEAKLQQVQERLSAMQQEYNQARDEQLQHADTINTLNKKLLQAQQEKDSIHRKFLKEVSWLFDRSTFFLCAPF